MLNKFVTIFTIYLFLTLSCIQGNLSIKSKLLNQMRTNNQKFLFVNAEPVLNMREEPNLKAKIIISIPNKSHIWVLEVDENIVEIQGNKNVWYKVSYNDYKGWVFGAYLSETKNKTDERIIPHSKYLIIHENKKLSVGLFKNGMTENQIKEIANSYENTSLIYEWYEDGMEMYPQLILRNNKDEILLKFYYDYYSIDYNNKKVNKNSILKTIDIISPEFMTIEGVHTGMTIKEIIKIMGNGYYHRNECDVPSWVRIHKYPCLEFHPNKYPSELFKNEAFYKIYNEGYPQVIDEKSGELKAEYIQDLKINRISLSCDKSLC